MSEFIGGRIVPKHCGVWDGKKAYEPLSIVLEEESGDSYISRKDVPAGTGLSQTAYWALCARFSEQAAQLREDTADSVAEMEQRTSAAESLTNSNKSQLETLVSTTQSSLEKRMTTIESRLDSNVKASTDSSADYAAEVADARVDWNAKSFSSLEAHLLNSESSSMKFLPSSSGEIGTQYPDMKDLPVNTFCYINTDWFEETGGLPGNRAFYVFTFGAVDRGYYCQYAFSPSNGLSYMRKYPHHPDEETTTVSAWSSPLQLLENSIDEINTKLDTTHLHYVSVTESNMPDFCPDMKDLPANSVVYINSSWFEETGGFPGSGVFFIITLSSGSKHIYTQFAFSPYTGAQYYRRYNPSTETLSEWSRPITGLEDSIDQIDTKLDTTYLHYVNVSEKDMPDFCPDMKDLPANSVVYINSSWFEETGGFPDSGVFFVITLSSGSKHICTQFAFSPYTGSFYFRRYNPGTNTLSNWFPSGKYYAFGDSLTYGQTSEEDTSRAPVPYPVAVGRVLKLLPVNKGIRGQGLINRKYQEKTAIETIQETDLSDASLITVAFGRNDSAYSLGTSEDESGAETICGKLREIMDYLRETQPSAQLVFIAPTPSSVGYSGLTAGGWSIDTYEEEAGKICREKNIPLVSWKYCSLTNSWETFAEDNVHPTSSAYLQMGAYMAGQIGQYYRNFNAVI